MLNRFNSNIFMVSFDQWNCGALTMSNVYSSYRRCCSAHITCHTWVQLLFSLQRWICWLSSTHKKADTKIQSIFFSLSAASSLNILSEFYVAFLVLDTAETPISWHLNKADISKFSNFVVKTDVVRVARVALGKDNNSFCWEISEPTSAQVSIVHVRINEVWLFRLLQYWSCSHSEHFRLYPVQCSILCYSEEISKVSLPTTLPVDLHSKLVIAMAHLQNPSVVPALLQTISDMSADDVGDLFLDITDALQENGYYNLAKPLLEKLVKSQQYSLVTSWLSNL